MEPLSRLADEGKLFSSDVEIRLEVMTLTIEIFYPKPAMISSKRNPQYENKCIYPVSDITYVVRNVQSEQITNFELNVVQAVLLSFLKLLQSS